MRWHDLLFAHWPVEPESLLPVLPAPLGPKLDIFQGSAWVGVIPFWMSGVRARFAPPVPTAHTFPELNVRTYVTVEGKPGVYFFTLDAASLLAVFGARLTFGLNYKNARMSVKPGDWLEYECRRTDPPRPAEFLGSYRAAPNAAAFAPQPGSLEHFVAERYCLYVADSKQRVWRGNIHHLPWKLKAAEWNVRTNTMAQANGIELPATAPMLHYADVMDVLAWPPERAM
jgi:uncharacterized protein YqjF (DUF2071 family)